jgi:hypothetical protein
MSDDGCHVLAVQTQTAPPLDSFNELLRLCDAHGDVASAHKVMQLPSNVQPHCSSSTSSNTKIPRGSRSMTCSGGECS